MDRTFCFRFVIIFSVIFGFFGCGVLHKQKQPEPLPSVQEVAAEPLTPEEANELLSEVGSNWLYGEGVGATTLNVATSVAFPPYAIYLLGNAILSVSGYEPVYVSSALPEGGEKIWDAVYSEFVSVPGRAAAAVAREEFRTREDAQESLRRYLKRDESHKNLHLYLKEG